MATIRYAKSGSVHIAYQVFGRGPCDLVMVPGAMSHQELIWDDPVASRLLERLGRFARVISFDKRGQGLSDRGVAVPMLEERADDLRAVMDAAGSERAAILGVSEGGALAALFAASNPARVSALILLGTCARWSWASDYPAGIRPEVVAEVLAKTEKHWGEGVAVRLMAPSRADDPAFHRWWCMLERMSASPGDIVALYQMIFEIDVRKVLPTIRVPTLVLHRREDRVVSLELARDVADRIPGARFVALEGADHFPFVEAGDDFVDEIEEFLTGARRTVTVDRILATLLFVDIVGSTEQVAKLGDSRWSKVLQSYYGLVDRQLARFGGRKIGTAGDGLFASFDGPARAVRCAMSIRDAVRALGLEVRAGVHTGECEIIGDNLGGIAVHIAARICDLAAPTEVLVSSTVRDLVAGSGLSFTDRGIRPLKGVADEWRLFAVA